MAKDKDNKEKKKRGKSRVATIVMPLVFVMCIVLGAITIKSLIDTTNSQLEMHNKLYAERYDFNRLHRVEFQKNWFALETVSNIVDDGVMQGAIIVSGAGDILASNPEINEYEFYSGARYNFAGMLGYILDTKGVGTHTRRFENVDYVIVITEIETIDGYLLTYERTTDAMKDVLNVFVLTILIIVLFVFGMFFVLLRQDRTTNNLGKQLNAEEVLIKCARCLANNRDFDSAINELLGYLTQYYQSSKAYIFISDYVEEVVNCEYAWDAENNKVLMSAKALRGIPILNVQPHIDSMDKKGFIRIVDRQTELTPNNWGYNFMFDQDIYSILAVPLKDANGKIYGGLAIGDPEVNIDTSEFLVSVASFVMEEIIKKEYTDMLVEMSYSDKMTKLFNRQAYMNDIAKLSEESTKQVGVVFADVNGLKTTNDRYGHESGDQLIIKAASVLKKIFSRSDDYIYRIGGDEFVVLSKNISEYEFNEDVQVLLEEIGVPPIMSIGETWIETCDKLEEQVKMADERMYVRKSEYYSKYMERRSSRRGKNS